jgi:hypothetical protein
MGEGVGATDQRAHTLTRMVPFTHGLADEDGEQR